ncbi:MAG TPA: SufE family protein [Gemmatimonadaceae bacterium]|nr:SufE family protein [Gemmatimonadaceae bacterium]
MSDSHAAEGMPPAVERVLRQFRALGREEKMQALLHHAKRLEPVPERFAGIDRASFAVHECQTPVALFPEHRDGRMYYYAEVDARQSPTVAAFLAILFSAINGATPAQIEAIPLDFVRQVMDGIGLAGREAGLTAMLARVKRHAALTHAG